MSDFDNIGKKLKEEADKLAKQAVEKAIQNTKCNVHNKTGKVTTKKTSTGFEFVITDYCCDEFKKRLEAELDKI